MEIKVIIQNPPASQTEIDNLLRALMANLSNYGGARRIPRPQPSPEGLTTIIPMRDADGASRALVELNNSTLGECTILVQEASGPGRNESAAGHADQFVNPYTFLPVQSVKQVPDTLRHFGTHNSHWQDRFQEDRFSGRVVCEVTTETDLFIGAGKEEEASESRTLLTMPSKVRPFTLNNRRAIPPTSLKGMLSSVMEAASNSAPRVLDPTKYSRRQDFRARPPEILSKIGMVIFHKDETQKPQPHIIPLKTAAVESSPTPFPAYDPRDFHPGFAVYLDTYNRDPFSKDDLLNHTPAFEDFSVKPQYWYLDIRTLAFKVKDPDRQNPEYRKLGYRLADPGNAAVFITPDVWEMKSQADRANFKKGVFKILGLSSKRHMKFPRTKKHEFFLFVDENAIPIPAQEAVQDFEELAEMRARLNKKHQTDDDLLPYAALGRNRRRDGIDVLKVKEGDLVYYEVDASGTKASKISFSACWRDFCGDRTYKEKNQAFGYFELMDSSGLLLPPSRTNQGLKSNEEAQLRLTPVCALLGFVEEGKAEGARTGLALAGRLFFSPGVLSPLQPEGPRESDGEKIVKILDSPKPPCPEFYFYRSDHNGLLIRKKDLQPDGSCFPAGRKVYWRHHAPPHPYSNDETYIIDNFRQLARINPVLPGTRFLFAIDFYNLTSFELGLLLYSLKPTENFRHALGMGKPLGMGRIDLNLLSLSLVDRTERYLNDDLFADHFFHRQEVLDLERLKDLAGASWDQTGEYSCQRFCPSAPAGLKEEEKAQYLKEEFEKTIRDLYGQDWLIPLELTGDPAATEGLAVHYPLNPQAPANARWKESFKWWMANQRGQQKSLPPVPRARNAKAPTLPCDPQ